MRAWSDTPEPRLVVGVTFAALCAAASSRRFMSFGAVADANGVAWPSVRRRIGEHLRQVCAEALAHGGPLISSIVVNREHVRTGEMEDETRAGFLAAARELGFSWADGRAFLREQQDVTFRWAALVASSGATHETSRMKRR